MQYRVRVNSKELQVTLTSKVGSQLNFVVNGESYAVDVAPILARAAVGEGAARVVSAPPPARSAGPAAPGAVAAPMPGIIVNVLVKAGQQVKAGETVVVMEAMKMENNIPATKDGTVEKVHVKKGDEVQNGQALVQIA
ncbi:MAG: biotin/lipoyl-binding protein [Oligoflexia bacterium]|nr:biotin/lipoyl-binding protein [Oligoflexia bacterium]